MIITRGHRRRSRWQPFSAWHAGVCDALAHRPPNSPQTPRTIDDVRYYIGYATGAHCRRRERAAAAAARHNRELELSPRTPPR